MRHRAGISEFSGRPWQNSAVAPDLRGRGSKTLGVWRLSDRNHHGRRASGGRISIGY
jgi:hypothetical protein